MRRRAVAGQSLVEFALLLPVMLLMLFGVIDFGRAIFQYSTTAEGARQAGRLAVVDQRINPIIAQARASAIGISLDADPDGVRVCFKDSAMSSDAQLACSNTAPATLCNGGGDIQIGCLAVVETRSLFSPLTPIIGRVVGPFTLSSRSVNPVEYVCPTASKLTCP